MAADQQRLIIMISAFIPFVIGFVFSFVYYPAVFNKSTQITIDLQQSITSHSFQTFMNVISNLFNPVVCAGYILILYLLTARKLQVIAFLIWFLFLSWMISLLKQVYQQPRPFWVSSDVQMLEWNCYTQYGSPSGHSALVIVLLDFFVRFACRWSAKLLKIRWVLYILIFCIQLLVMFSRLYLGMHSLNQIMLGFMIGAFSLIPYYLYIEKYLYFFCLHFLSSPNKALNYLSMFLLAGVIATQQTLMTYLPSYEPPNNPQNEWIRNIMDRPKCSNYNYSTSFFYRCFQDESIGFGIPALLVALSVTLDGQYLLKKFAYSRKTLKYWAYLGVIIITSLIPIAVFLNPFWKKINSPNLPVIIWITHAFGFIFGIVFMIGLSTYILKKLELHEHQHQSYYQEFNRNGHSVELSGLKYLDNIEQARSTYLNEKYMK